MNKLRRYLRITITSIVAAMLFILMLPLTIMTVSLLIVSGLVGTLLVGYKLRQSNKFFRHSSPNTVRRDAKRDVAGEKMPIEGSFTVLG